MTITLRNQTDRLDLDEKGEILPSDLLIERVRALRGDTILLSFSCGKDSIAMWLYLRPHFQIIPYFLYWVPGLSFVEESLTYYENYFGQRIMRLPHPIFYQYLNNHSYQTPEQTGVINALDLPNFDFSDVDNLMARQHGLEEPFTAVGFRAKDNIDRRNIIIQQGALGSKKRRYYYGIWDWDIEQVAGMIIRHKIKLPVDYKLWGRTIAAFDYQYLKPISEHFPADFERIKEWFPMIDLEFFRYEQVGQ